MRLVSILVATAIAIPLTAQSYYVPSNTPTAGACNVIPFGSTTLTTWGNQVYQSKATAADLGSVPNLITGLGFSPCGTGSVHFDQLEIVLDHHPAGLPLSTTFASNLTPSAVTVLSASNYTWHFTANTWNEIGLQNFFVFNGIDDLVIQITTTNSINTVASQGFHRDVRQRVYWFATSGPAPATGSTDSAAQKFEVGMMMARVSSHGAGCAGTNGIPSHNTSGVPQPGQVLSLGLANGVPNGVAFLVIGFYNGTPPFPLDLSAFGLPGCFQYTDSVAIQFAVLDGTGTGAVPFVIPNDPSLVTVKLYSQFACVDPPANAAGLTTSNYNRILIGN